MSETEAPLPAVEFINLEGDGAPYLEAHKCQSCDAIYLGKRSVCSKCFTRDALKTVKLNTKGTLYSYSIVHRSFPGVEVPFVSAIVDLEGGGTVKGNLINIEPDPDKVKLGMPVEVIFDDAGRKDKKGRSYISYFFQPAA
ncbi:MAG: Zn-ribbon domain-containing OB-fold protein [Alphaproteobacteria bacterium]